MDRFERIAGRLAIEVSVASHSIKASAEKEVERLLMPLLRGTPYAGKAYAVGGYVRDEVLGLDAKDLDIVVEIKGGAERLTNHIHDAFPEEVGRPIQMGKSYPIWEIVFKGDVVFDGKVYQTAGAKVQFADTQKEMFPDETSRQRETQYGDLKDDVERRDFTVNMLLKDLSTGELKDLTGTSVQDIKDGVLRGHPAVNFDKILSDDPLRMVRLVRFQVKYGWNVPISVLKAVKRNAARINIISGERIRDELIKIMEIGRLAQAVRLMKMTGLLQHILPEVQALGKTMQEQSKGVHQEGNVYKHTLLVLKNAKAGIENQLAALLHDIGKPASQEVIEGLIKFKGHEKVGGEIAEAIMRRLKFDSNVIQKVRVMVENHMRPHNLSREEVTPKALRRFIREVGDELVDAVLDLAEADSLGNLPPENLIPDLRQQIEVVKAPAAQAEKLPLDGDDVQRLLGIGRGKMVGDVLKWLKDTKYEWELVGTVMTPEDAEKLVLDKFGGKV
jgi:putative nucleotidyltransferase with HDIG domain